MSMHLCLSSCVCLAALSSRLYQLWRFKVVQWVRGPGGCNSGARLQRAFFRSSADKRLLGYLAALKSRPLRAWLNGPADVCLFMYMMHQGLVEIARYCLLFVCSNKPQSAFKMSNLY